MVDRIKFVIACSNESVLQFSVGFLTQEQVWYFTSKNKTARPLNILIHSRALLAAILSQLDTLASQVIAHFWRYCSRPASCHRVYDASAPCYHSYLRLLILAMPVLKEAVKLAKMHGMWSVDKQPKQKKKKEW